MMTLQEIVVHVVTFAAEFSSAPVCQAFHRPESDAEIMQCFENVRRKVARDGGNGLLGWMFHYRQVADIPGPGYLLATHHAVWHAPNRSLIDVTPFHPDEKHRPITAAGNVIFAIDESAVPKTVSVQGAPVPLGLPSRFYALDGDPRLSRHLAKLRSEEQDNCDRDFKNAEQHAAAISRHERA